MQSKDIRDRLKRLGFSKREIPVYELLLTVKQAKAADIADFTGIHRPNVYPLLRSLMERGFVTCSKGRIKYFSAVAPDRAFQSDLEQKRKELSSSKTYLSELMYVYKRRDETPFYSEGIEILTLSQVDLVLDWIRNTNREMLSVHVSPTPPRKVLQKRVVELDKAEIALMRRNVTVRCLYSQSVLEDPAEHRRMKRMLAAGEQGRCHGALPMMFIVLDTERAIFTVYNEQKRYTTYLVTAKSLVLTLKHSFEHLWSESKPLPDMKNPA
ncbi:helix-turn-helix domain-containing protein [bacterium]|nr:helix-turn-helix domain-containing protein [candidate division CSSED10-310 bacterium]